MSSVPFPTVPISETTVFRPFTPAGLFAYRHVQALDLLRPPDDLTDGSAIEFEIGRKRPLAALVIFLSVVALEDFFRDIGSRLADVPELRALFPHVEELARRPIAPKVTDPFGRRDDDRIGLLKFARVNDHYSKCVGVAPVDASHIPQLEDLALIRHAVAHNGSIVRQADAQRFQYYTMQGGQMLNPPVPFVRDVCDFVYQRMREFERAVQDAVFARVFRSLGPRVYETSPELMETLIEIFNFFDKILTKSESVPMTAEYAGLAYFHEQQKRTRAKLVEHCVEHARARYA